MNIKIYNTDSHVKQINVVIREILKNNFKNINIYVPSELENESLSIISKFKFKNLTLKHTINFINIQIKCTNYDEYINFYLANKEHQVAKLGNIIENRHNIIVLNSFEGNKIAFDKHVDKKIDVIEYSNNSALEEKIDNNQNEKNNSSILNEIDILRNENYEERLIEEKLKIEENISIDIIKVINYENRGAEIIHIDHSKLRKVLLGIIAYATKRVDIMSPWINDIACDEAMIELLRNTLKRGVNVNIVYGIGDIDDSRDKKSEQVANKLIEILNDNEYKGRLKIVKDNTHYKAILCDDSISFCGSLNYLSCNPDITKAKEGADYICSNENVAIKRRIYFNFGG